MVKNIWLPKTVIEALNQPVVNSTVKEEKPPCPKCNLNSHVRKNGFKRGRQMWRCNVCHSGFFFPYAQPQTREKNEIPKKRVFGLRADHTVELPFYDCANTLKSFNKPRVTIDSIFGIPCFCCLEASRGCLPNSCAKLEVYLLKEVENYETN